LHTIGIGSEFGPEHMAIGPDGKLYAAMTSGNLLRMDPDGAHQQVFASTGGRVLGWRPLVWVGKRSYSLYLWQQLFLNPYHQTLLQMFPVNIACAVACADSSYRFIERPLNRLRARYRPEVQRVRVAPDAAESPASEPAAGTSASPAASRT
jgi:peptidoglycan/LPS O-acetylase OafA/YrhL